MNAIEHRIAARRRSASSASAVAGKPPRLLLRFAVYTGIVLLLAGLAILWSVHRDVTARAERALESQARLMAEATLSQRLEVSDFAEPVAGTRRAELDALFRESVFVGGVLRVKLFNRSGTITYSNERSLIGRKGPPAQLDDVLKGGSQRKVTWLEGADGARTKVLEAFVPVRLEGSARPLGALELYQDYRAVDLQIQDALRRLGIILALAFLTLYASLFPILRRVTAQLEARNRRLREQAEALQRNTAFVQLLQEVAVAANESSTSKDALQVCLDRVCAHAGWPVGHVYLVDPDSPGELAPTTVWHLPDASRFEAFRKHSEATRFAPGVGLSGRVLAARKPVWVVDVTKDANFPRAKWAKEAGLKAGLAFPVLVGSEVVAVLEFFSTEARELDPPLMEVMAHIGAQLGRVIERERAAEEREHVLAGERAARSEAEATQRLLAAQNERLRELDRLKDEFVSLVSHELRTPLTSIRGYLELVLEGEAGELTPDQHRFLAVVERNSDRLLDLVGDLLFLAQVDGGKLDLELRAVDFTTVAAESVEAARPAAEDKGIDLRLLAEPQPLLLGDRARLSQVIDNLLSNALKFTPDGGRVEVRTLASNGHVLLEVEDTGHGIPSEERAQVFERFFRSSRASERAIPGTGLGLAIVKAIVESHEGRVEVESEEGVGSTFRVALPFRRPHVAEAAKEEAAA